MSGRTITLKRPTPRKSLGYVRGSVMDEPGEDGWERKHGAVVHVLFNGIPLSFWHPLTEMDAIEALNDDLLPLGVAYRIGDWHTGGTRPSPTGRDLHFVYAALKCVGPVSHSRSC